MSKRRYTRGYHIMLSEEDRKKVDIMRSSGVEVAKLLREYIRQLYDKGKYTAEWNDRNE